MRKLILALACRNNGSRLYGKPLQNLDTYSGVKILDNILACISAQPVVSEIVLGIAEGCENSSYIVYVVNTNENKT